MNFEIDAAGAHRPNKFEQWISKSTPLAPIAQNKKQQDLEIDTAGANKPEMMDFEVGATPAHNPENFRQ
jgi:hypothetical protein